MFKPDSFYDNHNSAPKALAWAGSVNCHYDEITNKTNGFNELDTLIAFKKKNGRNEVKVFIHKLSC